MVKKPVFPAKKKYAAVTAIPKISLRPAIKNFSNSWFLKAGKKLRPINRAENRNINPVTVLG